MGTVRLGVFPSINNKIMQDKIANQVCDWFINKFPVGFFNHVYIDTQNKNASQYIINSNGEFAKYESGQKIVPPNIRFTIEQGANNIKDAFNGIYNVNMKPGAFTIDTDLEGYKPIYEDCYGSILAINDYPIRNNISVTITLQTKADQLAVANILNSNFKAGTYGDIIVCDSVIPLPNLLMEYFRSCFFKPEIMNLSKMKTDDPQYDSYKKEINKKFMEFIYRFSNGAIKPYKAADLGVSDYNFVYGYERKQRVFIKFDDPDLDTGSKKGNVYDHFNITLSGSIDYANLISFITSVPAIIRGTKNNWYLKTSDNRDKNLYYSTMKFKEVYRENRFLKPISSKYIHFYLERELLMSLKEESFDLLDEILIKKQFPAHYHVMKALLSMIKSQEDFNKLFKVCIYKDRYLIEDYEIDKNFHFKIHNCDLSVPYYIDIFLRKDEYQKYLDKMENYLDKHEINWNEVNYNTNRGYNNNMLYGSFKGKIIKNHNEIQFDPNYIGRDISKMYTSSNPDRGSTWNIRYNDGEQGTATNNVFSPIKTQLYLVPDPSYEYYIKEYETGTYDSPLLVKDGYLTKFDEKIDKYYYYNNFNELIENKAKEPNRKKEYYHYIYKYTKEIYTKINVENGFNINKDYYIYDSENKKYLHIDINKALIPNPYFKYYIKNKETGEFMQVKNISEFQDGVEYYLNLYDNEVGNIIIKANE